MCVPDIYAVRAWIRQKEPGAVLAQVIRYVLNVPRPEEVVWATGIAVRRKWVITGSAVIVIFVNRGV